MQLRILNDAQDVIWLKAETAGMSYLSVRHDGTLEKIIALLESALKQAQAEAVTDFDVGSVAERNSAALEEMLERQLFVDVSHHPVPDPRGSEEGLPGRGRSEVNPIPGLPDRYNVPCEVCTRRSEL